MSGGSYNYFYSQLDNFIYEFSKNASSPERKAFLSHLILIKEAIHDIEWVDSGDSSPSQENKAIMKCISNQDILKSLIEEAKLLIKQLNNYI